MIAALQRCAALIDGSLTSAAYHHLHEPAEPGASTIGARFGSWAAALDAAQLPPTPYRGRRQHRWTHDEALDLVRHWAAAASDTRLTAYAAAASNDPDLPRPDQLARMFGGWRKILKQLDTQQCCDRPNSCEAGKHSISRSAQQR